MKTIDSIIKGGKRSIAGILAASMLYGCAQPSDGGSGGGTNPPIEPPVITAPVFVEDNCPSVVYENTSGECQLNVTGTGPITYSVNSAGAIIVDPNTGKVVWNSPEVPQDATVIYTTEACNSAGCDTKERTITVKDVPVGENTLPTFNKFDFTNGSIHDDANILQLRRKTTEGTIDAIDAQGDNIYYEMFVNGNLTKYYLNGNAFRIIPTPSDSTADVADLGDVVVRLCDEQNFDFGTNTCTNYNEYVRAYGEINPVQGDAELTFNINTYKAMTSATSTGNPLNKLEVFVSDGYEDTANFSGDTYVETRVVNNNPTPYGAGWIELDWWNNYGDHRLIRKEFYVPNESEWRADVREVLDANTDKYKQYYEDGTVYGDGGDVKYDFLVIKNDDSWAFMNYKGEIDNLTEVQADEQLLVNWGSSHLVQYQKDRNTIKSNATSYVIGGF